MSALVSDTGVVVSLVVAAVLVMASLAVPAAGRIRAVTGAIALAAISTGLVAGDVALDRYDLDGVRWHSTRVWVAVAVAVVVAGLAVAAVSTREPATDGAEFSVVLAGASLGIFLCVPETDLLRLVPAALAVPALAVLVGHLRPFGPVAVFVLSAALGWIVVIDGVARGSAAVGALACLATPLLGPLVRHGSSVPARPAPPTTPLEAGRLVLLGVVVLGCSRIAGLRSSAELAALWATAFLVVGAAALWRLERRTQNSSMVPSGS